MDAVLNNSTLEYVDSFDSLSNYYTLMILSFLESIK